MLLFFIKLTVFYESITLELLALSIILVKKHKYNFLLLL